MSVVDEVQQRVRERIAELAPIVAEYEQLMELERTFTAPSASETSRPRTRTSRAARGRSSATKTGTTPKSRNRPKRRTRADEAVALITENPGISVPDLADKMGIDPNYLYRVVPRLEKEKRVRREGKAWHPA